MIVTNTGAYAAAEIAQLYMLASPNATHPTPPIKLVGFTKTTALQPGASAALSFIVTPEHRSIVLDYDHTQAIEPGIFPLAVGGQQPDLARGIDGGSVAVLHASFANSGKGPLAKCNA